MLFSHLGSEKDDAREIASRDGWVCALSVTPLAPLPLHRDAGGIADRGAMATAGGAE
jgi:hypothetical protein